MLSSTYVALDPGSTSTRMVALRGGAGSLQVVAAERRDTGPSGPPLAELIPELKGQKLPTGGLTLGAGGQIATLRYNLLPPVPDWRLEMILKYETEEMAEKSGEKLSSAFLQLDVPESQADDRILLVGLGKEEQIDPIVASIEGGGGRVRQVLPAAIGLYHAYAQSHARTPEETVILADLGHLETHIVIVIEGRLVFARSVNFGGAQVDEAIAASLGVSESQARQLKERLSEGRVPGEVRGGVENAVRSSLGQLMRILESSVSFCRLQTKIPSLKMDRILLSGGTACLSGLVDYISAGFKVPTELFSPQVSGDLPGQPHEWVIPIGLAAASLDADQRVLDLLPSGAKAKREFRERTVFMFAGGGVLVLTILVSFVMAFLYNRQAANARANLERDDRDLQRYRQEELDAKRENEVVRRQIERLTAESYSTRFQGEVLEALRRVTPAAISIQRMTLDRNVETGKVYFEMRIEGRADNSERKGIAHMDLFQQAIGGLSGVTRVEIEPGQLDDDGTYPFELLVSPYPKPEDPKRRSARGRGRK